MPVAPSSPIASPFQQLLPVDLPLPVTLLSEELPAPTPGPPSRGARREVSFGLLTAFCSPELVDRVVAECGRQERRRRLLPAQLRVHAPLPFILPSPLLSSQRIH